MQEWQEYETARREAVRVIGKRGVADLDALREASGTKYPRKMLTEASRKYRRKGMTVVDGVVASEHYLAACEHFDEARKRARHELGRGAHAPTRTFSKRRIRNAAEIAHSLEWMRTNDLTREFRNAYAHGDTAVAWCDGLSDCRVEVHYTDDHNGYSKSCKYAMRVWHVEINAMKMQACDMPTGRREIDGLITLGAEPDERESGVVWQVWKAVWAERGRGVYWHTRRGYIVQDQTGEITHGRTISAAIGTLRTKTMRTATTAGARPLL